PSAVCRPAGHRATAVVAHVRYLRAAPRIGKRDAQGRTLVLADFRAAAVTDEHRSPSQDLPPFDGCRSVEPSENHAGACRAELPPEFPLELRPAEHALAHEPEQDERDQDR